MNLIRKRLILILLAVLVLGGCQTTTPTAPPPEPFGEEEYETAYQIHFESFKTQQVLEMIDFIETSVPGFRYSNDLEGGPDFMTYSFGSVATGVEMFRGIHDVLLELGLTPDRDVRVEKSEDSFTLKRIVPAPKDDGVRPIPTPEPAVPAPPRRPPSPRKGSDGVRSLDDPIYE